MAIPAGALAGLSEEALRKEKAIVRASGSTIIVEAPPTGDEGYLLVEMWLMDAVDALQAAGVDIDPEALDYPDFEVVEAQAPPPPPAGNPPAAQRGGLSRQRGGLSPQRGGLSPPPPPPPSHPPPPQPPHAARRDPLAEFRQWRLWHHAETPLSVCQALHEQKVRLGNLSVLHQIQDDGSVWVALQVGMVACLDKDLAFYDMHAHVSLFKSDSCDMVKLEVALRGIRQATAKRHPSDFRSRLLFLHVDMARPNYAWCDIDVHCACHSTIHALTSTALAELGDKSGKRDSFHLSFRDYR